MGTNYFAGRVTCEHCGELKEVARIGKSSAGWPLHFAVDTYLGTRDWPTWKRFLSRPGIVIQNEYGNTIELAELEEIIIAKRRHWNDDIVRRAKDSRLTLDGDTYSEDAFR